LRGLEENSSAQKHFSHVHSKFRVLEGLIKHLITSFHSELGDWEGWVPDEIECVYQFFTRISLFIF